VSGSFTTPSRFLMLVEDPIDQWSAADPSTRNHEKCRGVLNARYFAQTRFPQPAWTFAPESCFGLSCKLRSQIGWSFTRLLCMASAVWMF